MSNHASLAPSLHRDYVHCPVTALAFFSTNGGNSNNKKKLYILSGEDTHLHVRDATTSRLCASIQIFPAQPIHGIYSSSSFSFSSSSPTTVEKGQALPEAQREDDNDSVLLVWGGPYVTVLARSTIEDLLLNSSTQRQSPIPLPILRAPDWIYHGAVSDRDPRRAVVITAHNEVLPLYVTPLRRGSDDGNSERNSEETCWASLRLQFGRLSAPRTSRPNLYSAQVRWTGADEVLVAAGTVFGEIVVWRCRGLANSIEREEEQETSGDGHREAEVLFVFTGHEGSIFGVDISPEIVILDEDSGEGGASERRTRTMRLLASCSDDRTIRVWDITDIDAIVTQDEKQPYLAKEKKERRHVTEARETGFGENILPSNLEASASHVSSKPLAINMGHVSRIWNVRFAPTQSSPSAAPGNDGKTANPTATGDLVLYSFGEDASAQKWRLNLDALWRQDDQTSLPPAAATLPLTHQAIMLRHSGKHIWSSAVFGSSHTSDKRTLIATGGSDGKINLIEDVEGGYTDSVMLTISGSEVASKFSSDRSLIAQAERRNQNYEAEQVIATPKTNKSTKKQRKGKKDWTEEEPFLMYGLLSSTSFLATTSTGRIFHGSLTGASVEWEEVSLAQDVRDDLQQYQIVRRLPSAGDGMVLLGSPTGKLHLYNNDRSIRQIYQMPGKIADVFPLPADASAVLGIAPSSHIVPIIVTTIGNPQTMRLLLLDMTLSEGAIRQEHTIELEKGVVVTAAGCCQEYLIFGTRYGALVLYKTVAGKPTDEHGLKFQQITRVDRPFTKDSVSCVIPLPSKKSSPSTSTSCPYFLTTSRDGRYRIYELLPTPTSVYDKIEETGEPLHQAQVQVQLRHEAVPPLGPVIEGAFFTQPTTPETDDQKPELILSGFRGKHFVVWNETRQTELASVECGGAYRSFTYHIEEWNKRKHGAGRNITFVWTKASRTCIYSYSPSSSQQWDGGYHNDSENGGSDLSQQHEQKAVPNGAGITTMKSGGHGREIKAVAAWGDLLATGAEDTALRIWRVVRRPPEHLGNDDDSTSSVVRIECLAAVEKHTTGIQHLKWATTGSSSEQQKYLYLLSSGGSEELFVWRVSTLPESRYEGLAVVCEGVYTDKTRDGDLRVMGFDVEVLQRNTTSTIKAFSDEEKVGCEKEEVRGNEEEVVALCISLVLSNSTLRSYRYSKTEGFELLAEGRYTGACLMQIRHLGVFTTATTPFTEDEHGPKNGIFLSEVHVLTASTDGHIALWKTSTTTPTLARSSCSTPCSSDHENISNRRAKMGEYVLVEALRLHQSSIKSLDLRPAPSRPSFSSIPYSTCTSTIPTAQSSPSYLLVTGGDDNALGFAYLDWKTSPATPTRTNPTSSLEERQQGRGQFSIAGRSLINGAHAAAITGLCITSVSSIGETAVPSAPATSLPRAVGVTVCTASNDQRVKSWRMNVDVHANGGEEDVVTEVRMRKVALVANRYSSVADCGDLETLGPGVGEDGDKRIVVAGVGMEVWKV